LLDVSAKQTEEAAGLRATTTALDREKDALQAALDERTERAAALDDQLSRRERDLSDMRVAMGEVEVSSWPSTRQRSKTIANSVLHKNCEIIFSSFAFLFSAARVLCFMI